MTMENMNLYLYDIKYNAMWFYDFLNNEIIASAIFLFSNGNMYYYLSTSRQEYQKYALQYLSLYKASIWLQVMDIPRLHLGGRVGAGHDNLYKFKRVFNIGQDAEFHIGKNI